MPVSSCPLDDLLPHRPPMTLLDEVVSVDLAEGTLVAAFAGRREWSGNWVAIELMAQAAAALAGAADRAEGRDGPPRPGFLLGTRKLTLDLPAFTVGARYTVRAHSVFRDTESASFDCAVLDGARTVATATLNAYRPPDVAAFLAGQRSGDW
jgi:predicted hotdog family 3-hydroxylacyl-ACP dehydratase